MQYRLCRASLCLATIIALLSLAASGVNQYYFHFVGNNFFPANTCLIIVLLLVFNAGLALVYDKTSYARKAGMELLYFTGLMALVSYASNQIQLTPFEPIDPAIIRFESLWGISMPAILKWTYAHPLLQKILVQAYNSLPWQMAFLPLLVIAAGKFDLIRQYYFMMLITVLVGFIFYYFFPTIAPASSIPGPLFTSEQLATGLKFHQIHQHMQPSTNEGGLIALPSFHVIWALLCIYLVKDWWFIFFPVLLLNVALIASCLLLGWHYPTDLITAFLLTAFAYYLVPKP